MGKKVVRLLHPEQFSKRDRRFKSTAFRQSSDGGIFSFDRDCAYGQSKSECAHIERYYKDVAGYPPVVWYIDIDELPPECGLTDEPSTSGDPCHRNIRRLTRGQSRKMIIDLDLTSLRFCDGDTLKPLGLSRDESASRLLESQRG